MRIKVKKILQFSFKVFVLPLYFIYEVASNFSTRDVAFSSTSQLLSIIPGRTGTYFRSAFYTLACSDTSQDISIGFLTLLSHANTTIGRGVYIGPQGNIGMCEIGKNTLLGSGVQILSGNRQHNFSNLEKPIKDQGGEYTKIRIGEDSWIGNGAIIMAEVGDKSIVAAGSVVTKPVAEKTIVAGNPARSIAKR